MLLEGSGARHRANAVRFRTKNCSDIHTGGGKLAEAEVTKSQKGRWDVYWSGTSPLSSGKTTGGYQRSSGLFGVLRIT